MPDARPHSEAVLARGSPRLSGNAKGLLTSGVTSSDNWIEDILAVGLGFHSLIGTYN